MTVVQNAEQKRREIRCELNVMKRKVQLHVESLEEDQKWKVVLQQANTIRGQLSKRAVERYELSWTLDELRDRAKQWEQECFLEISLELDPKNSGKKLYSNDALRKAAVEARKLEDSGFRSIREEIGNAEMELVAFDAETKMEEMAMESHLMYVRMIEARLKAFAAT